MTELSYFRALAADIVQRARIALMWRLVPADVISILLIKLSPMNEGEEARVGLSTDSFQRPK